MNPDGTDTTGGESNERLSSMRTVKNRIRYNGKRYVHRAEKMRETLRTGRLGG